MALLPAICLPLLAILFYEDQKYRAVSWIIFPFLAIVFIVYSIITAGLTDMLYNSFFNLSFLFIQLLLISLYFSIKEKRIVIITRNYLGLGDILFLLCLAFFFSPLNFIAFYFGSLFIIVIGVLLYTLLKRSYKPQLPLAGLQSVILMGLIIVNSIIGGALKFQEDTQLANYLLGS
jgi:hypothetical protein